VGFIDEITDAVGVDGIITEVDRQHPYLSDWTGRYRGVTPAVVLPKSTAEVVRTVEICAAHRMAWVPQGGNTGLVGGGVPVTGEVVVSTRRLKRLDPVDVDAWQVTVGAGVTLAELAKHCQPHGLRCGVDFGAREAATLGGMVATNAGGTAVVRFGMTRQQVSGLEVVLPDGSVISRLGGLVKDNTGYDLNNLMCGSEGTLGIVTAVRVKLHPLAQGTVTAALGVGSMFDALAVFAALRRSVIIEHCEIMRSGDVEAVCALRNVAVPPAWTQRWCLLVEAEASEEAMASALAVLPVGVLVSAEVAPGSTVSARWWSIREAHPELARQYGDVLKLDVSLPLNSLVTFTNELDGLIADVAPGTHNVVFGHLGDGNLHVNIGGDAASFPAAQVAVLERVLSLGGSISAEHGIGRLKRDWLERDRGPVAVAAMRAVKRALDPLGLANPDVLI
jgi:FAD/FMN-containing dehydrogenase